MESASEQLTRSDKESFSSYATRKDQLYSKFKQESMRREDSFLRRIFITAKNKIKSFNKRHVPLTNPWFINIGCHIIIILASRGIQALFINAY